MFLNGRCIGRYPEVVKYPNSGEPVALYLPECWLSSTGRNTLAVFDEEGQLPSGVRLRIEKAASREVIAVAEAADASMSMTLPPYQPVDMRKSGRLNLASDRPVTASSSDPRRPASDINDGDDETAWAPRGAPTEQNNAWVQVDLGRLCNVDGVEFAVWHSSGTLYSFFVEGSVDGTTWTMLADRRRSLQDHADFKPEGCVIIPFKKASDIRYVRLTIVNALEPRPDRIGIGELRVWGEGLH